MDFMNNILKWALDIFKIERLLEGKKSVVLISENFLNIGLILPSHSEQTLIANFLSSIDEKINHTQSEITKTEVWKKGLLQKMFV
ncbi:MAG: restriction endonuclease subunit S [Saprospiraceae bacterium]|nr:restriction endonuclease subunit S [Candidatus Brachybacter algidus]